MAFGHQSFDTQENNQDIAEINVIPLVDVLLVLLIIFMVAAPLSIQGMKVELPYSKAKGPIADEQRIVLTIQQKGEFYIDSEQIPAIKLEEKLQNIFKNREKKEMFIRADRGVSYGYVIDAMTAGKMAGVVRMSMLTQAPKK